MQIRKLYNQAFNDATLMSPSESLERWAEFGRLVYVEFLQKEDVAIKEKNVIDQDVKFLMAFISKKEKNRMRKVFNKEFSKKYL